MTCIVGLAHHHKVYMGCDSQATVGWTFRELVTPMHKVFRRGELLFGGTGRFSDIQLMEHILPIVPPTKHESDIHYLIEKIAYPLRDNVYDPDNFSSSFLIGYRGKLYLLASDFSVTCFVDGFDAVGSGDFVALGVMEARKDLPPKKRIKKALRVASKFMGGVGGPFHIEVLNA